MIRNEKREREHVQSHKQALHYSEWGGSEHENGGPFFNEELLILQLIECLLYFAPNLSSHCSLHLNLKK